MTQAADFTAPFGPDDPFAGPAVVVAHGPDYRPGRDDVPLWAHEWQALLDQCCTALDRRRAAYPEMIKRRLISADEAARDIAAWEALAAEWLWICVGKGAPPPLHTHADRIAAIELAMTRVRQELARSARTSALYRQAHIIQALHWHLVHQIHGEPRVWGMARLNHRFAAERAAERAVA